MKRTIFTSNFTLTASLTLFLLISIEAHEGTHSGGNDRPALANRVEVTESGQYRVFQVDSLPDHSHGRFPNPGNPHEITPQAEVYRIPLNPTPLDSFRPVGMGAFGLALNGILFEPAAAEFWQNNRRSGWQYEALGHHLDLGEDANHAHVQPTGKYHYHGVPTGLVENQGGIEKPALLGYAADGYPLYSHWSYTNPQDSNSPLTPLQSSYRVKAGARPSGPGGNYDGKFVQDYEYVAGLGDLDEANGRFGVTPDHPEGTYYYVITPTFPFIPRHWKGQPGPEFGRGPGAGNPNAGGGGNGPPNRRNQTRASPASRIPVIALLRAESFLSSLSLSGDQSSGLSRSLAAIESSMRRSRPPSGNTNPDDRRAQRLATMAGVEPMIAQARARWLDTDQNTQVEQTLRRQEGPNFLLEMETRESLSLDDAQFSVIYQAIINSRSAQSIPLSWPEIADLLNDSQRLILTELIGPIE
jgi:hypothetical protein